LTPYDPAGDACGIMKRDVIMLKNPFDLSGRAAVVAGGGTGLGCGMAEGLAPASAHVVLAGLRQAVVEQAAAELQTAGASAEGVELDVTRTADLFAFCAGIATRLGRLDILVNNVGTDRPIGRFASPDTPCAATT
jgi:NAD(P)-dependent dehydrogenase (short-subunit alcohol dehydrogenase family)